ncbi:hypothetical protein T484DRAFT_1822575 [Baffinella frigidus]|nr:hypothetical protein T484DRAFT_1822575 [Cryptophyta sp. CCMP2293]
MTVAILACALTVDIVWQLCGGRTDGWVFLAAHLKKEFSTLIADIYAGGEEDPEMDAAVAWKYRLLFGNNAPVPTAPARSAASPPKAAPAHPGNESTLSRDLSRDASSSPGGYLQI